MSEKDRKPRVLENSQAFVDDFWARIKRMPHVEPVHALQMKEKFELSFLPAIHCPCAIDLNPGQMCVLVDENVTFSAQMPHHQILTNRKVINFFGIASGSLLACPRNKWFAFILKPDASQQWKDMVTTMTSYPEFNSMCNQFGLVHIIIDDKSVRSDEYHAAIARWNLAKRHNLTYFELCRLRITAGIAEFPLKLKDGHW